MQRKRFLRDCQRIIQLQRAVRGWLNHRIDAATIIQRNVRRFLACRRRRKFAVGIVKFQVNTSCKKTFFLLFFHFSLMGFGEGKDVYFSC